MLERRRCIFPSEMLDSIDKLNNSELPLNKQLVFFITIYGFECIKKDGKHIPVA